MSFTHDILSSIPSYNAALNLNTNTSVPNNSSLYIGDCLKLDPDGRPYIPWMYDVMGECVHSGLEQASFYVGLLSLVLYLFGGIPQVITTFRKGHADGLSVVTLAQWMIADGSNLIGAALTGQLFTQILLAAYFVLMDFIFIGQYLFYNSRKLWRKHVQKKKDLKSGLSNVVNPKQAHDEHPEIITITDFHAETLHDEHPMEIRDDTKRKEVLEGVHISGDVSARVGVGVNVGAAMMPAHLHYQGEEETSSDTSSPMGENIHIEFDVPHQPTIISIQDPVITASSLPENSHLPFSQISAQSTTTSEAFSNNPSNPKPPNTKLYSFSTFFIVFSILIILSCSIYKILTPLKHDSQEVASTIKTGRKLLSSRLVYGTAQDSTAQKDHNAREFPPVKPYAIVGYVIGCVSTVCYMGSRIAQIVNNFRRGSTEGMNPVLFICSVVGNLLYALSIFLFSIDSSYLSSKIPWLASSLGNQFLDYTILSQYVFYTFIKKKKQNVTSKEKEIELLTRASKALAKIYTPINQVDRDHAKDINPLGK
ncbi:hypothetical protein C9374_010905 [Naegleria lovaniensis]|uniref:Uncharacterized protein n=1 Tax=Naegleria lovaniensis TaxID=51637 RepID=A0AA88GF53_NAELO|nr:uncharacterized protein C9374_010905 [Naegleria lovaniensis]KAG2374335.1 hypothetical protein C9374_010905 [Naegleria lovaniensis]